MKRKLKYPLEYKIVETTDGNRVISRHRNLENALIKLRRSEIRARDSHFPNRKFKLIEPATEERSAISALAYCAKNLKQLTGRNDWQIVVLYDHGNNEPYTVVTDSTHDADDMKHVRNCSSAATLEDAIFKFCKTIHANKGVAEPANDGAMPRRQIEDNHE